MSDKEILEKYIDLEKSCLTDKEKKDVMDMLYKYKEDLVLRDEIGTCPNIEVGNDVTDRSPFFIRPYHVEEEDKTLIDKNGVFVLFSILRKKFLVYSSPVMLISRKLMQDKRVVTNFRCLNIRKAKTIWHILYSRTQY